MNKVVSVIITFAFVVGIGIIFWGGSKGNPNEIVSAQNTEIKDGIQYITIKAKGGYTPQKSIAKANIPTILRFDTDSTFDCSSSVRIQSIGMSKILPQTGSTDIDLGNPKLGLLQGTCSMGMYSFEIDFRSQETK